MALFGEGDEEATGTEADGGAKGDEHGKGGPGAAKKKKVKTEHILIVLGVVGVVLTFIVYKRSSSTAATTTTAPASTTTTPSVAGSSGGGGAGAGSYQEQEAESIQSALTGFQTYLSNLSSADVGGTGSGTPSSSSSSTTPLNGTVYTAVTGSGTPSGWGNAGESLFYSLPGGGYAPTAGWSPTTAYSTLPTQAGGQPLPANSTLFTSGPTTQMTAAT